MSLFASGFLLDFESKPKFTLKIDSNSVYLGIVSYNARINSLTYTVTLKNLID